MVQCTAMVLSVAVFCSVALLCQASPVDWWESQFAREEEKKKLEEVAAHIISELESEMMIQQNGECLRSIFQYRMHAKLSALFEEVEDGDTGETKFVFRNLLNFTCISSDYSLFISKNGGKFEKAINSAIIYTCDLVNRSYRSSIQKKGEPRCAIPCMELRNFQNGAVSVKGNQPPLENDTANYSCDSGYQLSGTETRTCGKDGQWSGQEPSCIPQCPELQDIANGDVDYISQQPGANATYSCDPGYVLHGAETRTCGEDGQWSDQEPKCIPQCPELQDIANGVVHYISRQPGGTANYSCNPGYVLQGATTRTCGEDGEWSGQEPRCVRLCPVLVAPSNGTVNYDNREPGDVATYSCRDGYRLVGPEMRICARDQDGKWSGIHPVCETELSPPVIICSPDSLPITNGKFSPSSGLIRGTRGRLGYGVGTVVNYRCTLDRFELRGESSIICLESGEWSHPPPRCVAVKCPKLDLEGIPNSVEEIRRQLERDRPKNYKELLKSPFFKKEIKGNPDPYDEGSTAHLTCILYVNDNGWTLMSNSPSVQTCVRNSTNGDLYWTKPGICVYRYSITRPALTGGTG